MPTAVPRERTIQALREVWASLSALCAEVPAEQWTTPSPLPGWSFADNLAHIIGTEVMLSGGPTPQVDVDRDAAAHVRNDIGVFNEQWVEALRGVDPADVLAQFDAVTAQRLDALDALDDDAWNAVGFTPAGQDTHGRFMQIRVFDCWLHEQDMRDAVGRPGHERGLAVDVTLDELSTALGFVVGKRARVGAGSTVTFALTDGAVDADAVPVRTFHVAVGERAGLVEELSSPATVTLTMPVGVMTRLCAGRVALDAVRSSIVVGGDAEMAGRILASLNYTI